MSAELRGIRTEYIESGSENSDIRILIKNLQEIPELVC